jgi:hypothetical protein
VPAVRRSETIAWGWADAAEAPRELATIVEPPQGQQSGIAGELSA